MNLVGFLVLVLILLWAAGTLGTLSFDPCPAGQHGVCLTWKH